MLYRALKGVLNAARGVLIGIAEIIPGVSGGTIALIVGIYQTVIDGAAHVVRGVVGLVRGRGVAGFLADMRQVRWAVIAPVLVGMFSGIFLGAALIEPVISSYPEQTRAVFAGLILASLWVPMRMVARAWSFGWVLVGLAAAGASFLLTGLPSLGSGPPSLWWVAPAAALAVCALVLPGVSGSFLLVVLGVYQPTLQAVNERDAAYLGVFALGAIIGLASFVRVLQWLLENKRIATLVVMTGLMLGSLRALWPWQGEGRELLPPEPGSGSIWLWVAAGALAVVVVLLVERIAQSRVKDRSIA